VEQLREQESATKPNSLEPSSGISQNPANAVTEPTSTQQEQQHEERQEEALRMRDQQDSPTPIPFGAEFNDEMFEVSRDHRRQTRSEKRRECQEHARTQTESVRIHPLDLTPEEFQKLQEEDPSLNHIRDAASGGHVSAAGPGFYKKNGLIYRHWTPLGRDKESMSVEQLVLPQPC